VDGIDTLVGTILATYPFLDPANALRLARAYGTMVSDILGDARDADALGQDFGAGLTAREVDWLCANEFATTADDILWRRSKLGLHMTADQRAAVAPFLERADG